MEKQKSKIYRNAFYVTKNCGFRLVVEEQRSFLNFKWWKEKSTILEKPALWQITEYVAFHRLVVHDFSNNGYLDSFLRTTNQLENQ